MASVIPLTKEAKKRCITERHIYTQEIIKVLMGVNDDEVIPYEKLSDTIGMDVRPNMPGYGYQHSAREILERDEDISFDVIPTVGLKRVPYENVAIGTGSVYLKRKKSLHSRIRRRIGTVDDHYDALSDAAKLKTTTLRTMLAFDSEMLKPKNVRKIENKVQEVNKLVGFQDTIRLFEK